MAYTPKASSTPKTIKARRPIRSQEVIHSPIENNSNEKESSDSEQSTPQEEQQQHSSTYDLSCTYFGFNYLNIIYVIIIVLFLLILYLHNPVDTSVDGLQIYFENLSTKYPSQESDFWINIKVAVNDVIRFNQPKSIIFLYKDEATITDVLKSISDYGSSLICDSSEPIDLPGSYLRKAKFLKDYGIFIAEMKEKLNKQCVVIIRNLEQVPGITAQAFHSLCDEYNPIKENVLFLFTIKTNSFPEKVNTFVEKILRELWSDLKTDKFYPLYSRISTFMLPVQSEH